MYDCMSYYQRKSTTSLLLRSYQGVTYSDMVGKKRGLQEENPGLADVTYSKYFKRNVLRRDFYDQECEDLAKALIGKVICRKTNDSILKGMIVETESYLGGDRDGASHSYKGKRTERNAAMYCDAGTSYVYKIYGSYHCFNITSRGEGSAVLIRAMEAVAGHEEMTQLRAARRKDGGAKLKLKDLCNGPSKLCDALNITKEEMNFVDLTDNTTLWLEDLSNQDEKVLVTSTRIGIEGAGQPWSDLPLRFYLLGNKSVSARDKRAESEIMVIKQ
eukprot:TRINITY_DN34979_c0_g1_i1.p1 TRINITY_DN34979_c0_g1~~TRINITY_DN34979_c0_g1_i1.p1  ORF type:complete len:273 (-),score=40.27 TRINITY_DN34979_c0_g1_i1:625-1443(-)